MLLLPEMQAPKQLLELYNRFDYGFGGGLEIHPVMGLLIGARVNISLDNLYKHRSPANNLHFIPSIDVKNNVFQLYPDGNWEVPKKEKRKTNKKPTLTLNK